MKRGHKDDRNERPRDVGDIFDDDEEDDQARAPDGPRRTDPRGIEDEFAGFIEEDFEDEAGQALDDDDDADILRKPAKNVIGISDAAGLDEVALEDMKEAFGTGFEYDWALELQEQEGDERQDPDDPDAITKGPELKDVFEPSQLADKMLTDKDNLIRITDSPERFQIARQQYKDLELTEEEFREESIWISDLLWPKKALEPEHKEAFQESVAKVLEFMNINEFEVPFIFQHRKDYLIHAQKMPDKIIAEKLLNQTDLWDIFDLDLKFKALIDKRQALQRTYANLTSMTEDGWKDSVIEEMLPAAVTMEELQDVQDYLYFQHSSRLADLAILNATRTKGAPKRRPRSSKTPFERVRNGKVYGLVRAFGISADAFAQNALTKEGRRHFTEDPNQRPEDMADSEDILDPPAYPTGTSCLTAARSVFAEEIAFSPKMRKVVRQTFFMNGIVDCYRTDKGLRKIDDQHPFYDFKYLRNQQLTDIARKPDRFLRMLSAELDGLVVVKVRIENSESFRKRLYGELESDNFSEIADAWNQERRSALDIALAKLETLMARGVKEALKTECENEIAKSCREEYARRLDQAPYKPKGMIIGTTPRVLALSNGEATIGKEPFCWAYVDEAGRAQGNGKLLDLTMGDPERGTEDDEDVQLLVNIVEYFKPDVIGISGWSAETRKLYKQVEELVERKDLHGAEYEDENGNNRSDKLEVMIVNDEVARLYKSSDRANKENPTFAPLTKYCVGLAKYLQDPMKEYASLKEDIISIIFDPAQRFVSQEKIIKALDTAMVDMVNLCGVEINDAIGDTYQANLLPYVSGLGPRKAAQLLKVFGSKQGGVTNRSDFVGDAEKNILPALGPKLWLNAASFLYIDFDDSEPEADYLDSTRVHPQDYDIGRKMAADALEVDEEDIIVELQEHGQGGIVRKLIKDDAQDKVNDLILEEYAEQLERKFNQRKRATLETIRAELQQPYEELRRPFALLSTNEIFTMFTGETPDSLYEGMIVPISIKKVADDYIEAKLDCGIEGTVPALSISNRSDVSAKQLFSARQTVQAKITYLNRKQLTANFSLREEDIQKPYRREVDRMSDEWDDLQEKQDKESMMEKNDVSGRTQRVIKHPLFKSFNSTQAEEYLGSQARGDLVIRPSSRGLDHICVTWKVSDNVYQHIDVLELTKSNGVSSTTVLKVGGKDTYSDLDDLIVNHVKMMAKKVDEMMLHEKYQNLSKADTGGSSALLAPHCTADISLRPMVDYLHRSQPEAIGLQFLHRPEASRLLLPMLQGWSACSGLQLVRQGRPESFRATEEPVPEYVGFV